ncbi:MAG: hypothetical protein ACK5P5_12715 [Pseudobdellovibrionaceae bacterium]
MKRTTQSILSFSLAAFLGACSGGGDSDPLSKYNLREGGTDAQQKQQQTLLQSGKLSVELVSESESSQTVLNHFIEGQSSQILLKVTIHDPKILVYSMNLTQFPHIDQPTLTATDQPGVFAFVWTAPKGFIPPGQIGQALNVRWEIKVSEATVPELNGYLQTGSFPINISRSTEVPRIVSYDRFSKGVEEDQSIPFTVTIDDPNSKSENQIPFLSFTGVPYLNTEAYCADFAGRMVIDPAKSENPERLSDTRWKFHYRMDTRNLPIDRDRVGNENLNSPSVDVCFYLAAVSGVGQTTSAKFKPTNKANYAVKMPTLKWQNEFLVEMTGGEETKIRFETGIQTDQADALGQVSLSKQTAELARIPGVKSLRCGIGPQDTQIKQTCELTWKPNCSSTAKSFQLKFTVQNSLGSKKKEKLFTRDFKILKPAAGCASN